VNLVGFSDGSLSGDGNNGGYSWMVAVVENGTNLKGGVLAGVGDAALASDNTNVLLSSTRMEALGLAAGMSYARNWVGKVDWYIDSTGVINNFRRMHR
jgi:ribonuclease HI